ncbi:MAG TPA: TetR/AcrR family transcriptional regulator [Jiangellaceae bacterium]|nr:TetR/AcrR family transcriptional regulator [Jiangellaceae bacterium]
MVGNERSSTTPSAGASTRERILDAAAKIMRRDGLVRATTKEIARAAQCSEALLYKYFPNKQDIFLSVLTERSPDLDIGLAESATVRENLVALVERLVAFYAANFPLAVSIFGSIELLTAHREAMRQRGAGPHGPSMAIARYLEEEGARGRISDVDVGAVARLLTGAALHEAFLAAYEGDSAVDPGGLAQRLVDALTLD